jgi:hypothetical protein
MSTSREEALEIFRTDRTAMARARIHNLGTFPMESDTVSLVTRNLREGQ